MNPFKLFTISVVSGIAVCSSFGQSTSEYPTPPPPPGSLANHLHKQALTGRQITLLSSTGAKLTLTFDAFGQVADVKFGPSQQTTKTWPFFVMLPVATWKRVQ